MTRYISRINAAILFIIFFLLFLNFILISYYILLKYFFSRSIISFTVRYNSHINAANIIYLTLTLKLFYFAACLDLITYGNKNSLNSLKKINPFGSNVLFIVYVF